MKVKDVPSGRVKGCIKAFENLGVSTASRVIAKSPIAKTLRNVKDFINKFEKGLNPEKEIISKSLGNRKPIVRESKLRHIFCKPLKGCDLKSLNISLSEKPLFCLNKHYFVVALKQHCYVFVKDLDVDKSSAALECLETQFSGTKILDVKLNPVDDKVFACCGVGGKVQMWRVKTENGKHLLLQLRSLCHKKDVVGITWHPISVDILVTRCSTSHVLTIWNALTGCILSQINCHKETIFAISFNMSGKTLATTCKDGIVRLIECESGHVRNYQAQSSMKDLQVTILKDGRLFVSGLSKTSMREISLWDPEDPLKPLFKDSIDYGISSFHHVYDAELQLLYLTDKGDTGFRVFEISNDYPYIHYITRYTTSSPYGSDHYVPVPKEYLDDSNCEIQRLVRLDTAKRCLEEVSVRVPRRYPESFKIDVYPISTSKITTPRIGLSECHNCDAAVNKVASKLFQ